MPWRAFRSVQGGPWGSLAASRVLRGGSWDNNTQNLRAAHRNDNPPDERNNNIGFRVCRVAHIVIAPVPEIPADPGWQGEARG